MKMVYNTSITTASHELIEAKGSDPKASLLRICRREAIEYRLENDFLELTSENFLSARTSLNRLAENGYRLPTLIVIDLPYVKREVYNFIEWLNKSTEFCRIPVIYDQTFLSSDEIKEICSERLVDDVVNVTKNIEKLYAKAEFLRTFKKHQLEKNSLFELRGITIRERPKMSLKQFLKRSIDISISLFMIILLLPLFILIAIAVKLESKGPIIYTSKRAGKGYSIFQFYKFRTMYIGADNKREELEKLNLYSLKNSSARFFKIKNDPRVTRIGAFLRNTSLDELPQLFNVLKGDMSIVGNRPLPLYEAATLTTDEWVERFMAPAGITGLWQIKKRGREQMSVEERINLDVSYAKNNNLLKDLWIIAKTPSALFQKANV